MPFKTITDAQKLFLVQRGVALDAKGYAINYEDNLFAPLGPNSLSELAPAGQGKRIAAPHGSTALAANSFDWWRGRNLSPLSTALGISVDRVVGYERAHSPGLRGGSAMLDIEFVDASDRAVAVEVKLREPYGAVKNELADAYFVNPGIWSGLPNLQSLADDIRNGKQQFVTLHAAQLIKHALGLHRSYGSNFTLAYYWHHVPSNIGDVHRAELATFSSIARLDIDFHDATVDDLLARFQPDPASQAWFDYMSTRYL